ncbi:MAG: hypothetical protein HY692_04590, partial [Cyanobacteria bacterium NC_groundwater_1444_Ag_S-0.65um_54_12]|nr:hypothetical protein [Cyanobacteria bacterium NC_groundwater_1444_Ag_S-0.65um_54_12]
HLISTVLLLALSVSALVGCGQPTVNGANLQSAQASAVNAAAKKPPTQQSVIAAIRTHFLAQPRIPEDRMTINSISVSATPLGHLFTYTLLMTVSEDMGMGKTTEIEVKGAYNTLTKKVTVSSQKVHDPVVAL